MYFIPYINGFSAYLFKTMLEDSRFELMNLVQLDVGLINILGGQ